jgi:pimeloyl-ACP methyl ester carboxylesterase
MARLYQDGHELFALDWLGHGLSDKPTQKESMTFELHIQTLTGFINHVELNDAILVAHHWGGYANMTFQLKISTNNIPDA